MNRNIAGSNKNGSIEYFLGLAVVGCLLFFTSCDCENILVGRYTLADTSRIILPKTGKAAGKFIVDGQSKEFEVYQYPTSNFSDIHLRKTGKSGLGNKGGVYNCREYIQVETQNASFYGVKSGSVELYFILTATKNASQAHSDKIGLLSDAIKDVMLVDISYANRLAKPLDFGPYRDSTYYARRVFPVSNRSEDTFVECNQTTWEMYPMLELNGTQYTNVVKVSLVGKQYTEIDQKIIANGNVIDVVQTLYYKKDIGLLAVEMSNGKKGYFEY